MPDSLVSLNLLIIPSPAIWTVLSFFFINLVISAIIAFIITVYPIQHLIKNRKALFAYLLSFQAFIPLFGSITIIIAIFLLLTYKRINFPVEIFTFPQFDYARKNAVKTVAYSEGWARIRLNKAHFDENIRKQALVSLSKSLNREVNLIYSELVSDDMEELRICAFSLLEKKQNYLHDKINQLLKIFNNADSVEKSAFFAKQLALVYWELVYLNLTDLEFRKIILERSYFYAEKALLFFTRDPILWILVSRINIENGNFDKGLTLLTTADNCHAPRSKTFPYFAEYSYINHDYAKVRKYLSSDSSFRDIPKIGKIVSFWCPQ